MAYRMFKRAGAEGGGASLMEKRSLPFWLRGREEILNSGAVQERKMEEKEDDEAEEIRK